MTLTLLKNTGHLSCWISLYLDLSGLFMIRFWLCILAAGIPQKWCWFFLVHPLRRHVALGCFIPGRSSLSLGSGGGCQLSPLQLLFSLMKLLVISWKDTLRLCKYFCFSFKLLATSFNIHWRLLVEIIITVVTQWWFSNSMIPFTVSKSFLFSSFADKFSLASC